MQQSLSWESKRYRRCSISTLTIGNSYFPSNPSPRKVAGSIPDGVIGIFYWHNPSGRTMSLGLTLPLTEMSTRNISWGVKVASAYGWQTCHHVLTVLKSGSLNLLEPSGPVQARNGIVLHLTPPPRKIEATSQSFGILPFWTVTNHRTPSFPIRTFILSALLNKPQ